MTTIEFFSLWEIDKRDKQFNYIKKRFLQEYPNSNPILTQHEDGEFVVKFFIIDYEDKNLDIYLCEEICNEFGLECFIYNDSLRKEFYPDEGDDYCMGRMGQKIRHKFQIKDFKKSTKLTDLKIELSDDSMIMIR